MAEFVSMKKYCVEFMECQKKRLVSSHITLFSLLTNFSLSEVFIMTLERHNALFYQIKGLLVSFVNKYVSYMILDVYNNRIPCVN